MKTHSHQKINDIKNILIKLTDDIGYDYHNPEHLKSFRNATEWLEQLVGTTEQAELQKGIDLVMEDIDQIKVEDCLEYDPATPERQIFVDGFNACLRLIKNLERPL